MLRYDRAENREDDCPLPVLMLRDLLEGRERSFALDYAARLIWRQVPKLLDGFAPTLRR